MGHVPTYSCGFFLLLLVCSSCGQDIRRPPSIVKGPEKLVVIRENNAVPVSLVCEATGSPMPIYEWYHDGMLLDMNNPSIQRPDNSIGTIQIRKSREGDNGLYQCIARNQYGKALSQHAEVKLAVIDEIEQQTVRSYSVNEGEPLVMYCKTGNTYPPPTYAWYTTDGVNSPIVQEVVIDHRVSIDTDGNLYFAHVKATDMQKTATAPDGRIYKCSVYNSYTEVSLYTSPSKIIVNELPAVPDKTPANVFATDSRIALAGREVKLKCLFSGKPEPRVTWERVGSSLPQHKTSYNELILEAVKEIDSGTYRCTGTNDKGRSYKDIEVNVESEPIFTRPPSALNSTEGESASFICRAYGTPLPDIQWYLNGDPIDPSNLPARTVITAGNTNLTITKTCKDCPDGSSRDTDLMNVQCNASNSHGSAFTDAYLNILLPTEFTVVPPTELKLDYYKEVIIPCEAKSDDSTPVDIRWYKDSVRIDYVADRITKTKEGHLHIITENDDDGGDSHKGDYMCEATNGYSTVTATTELVVEGAPPPPGAVAAASFDWWWIIIILVIILLLLILLLCCCLCCQRNRGEAYPIDEKEKKQGLDPEKELVDSGFQDYQRPEDEPMKGSRASLSSTIKLDSDDEGSLNEYADIDAGKFNEDGSFIGQYSEKKKGRRGESMV